MQRGRGGREELKRKFLLFRARLDLNVGGQRHVYRRMRTRMLTEQHLPLAVCHGNCQSLGGRKTWRNFAYRIWARRRRVQWRAHTARPGSTPFSHPEKYGTPNLFRSREPNSKVEENVLTRGLIGNDKRHVNSMTRDTEALQSQGCLIRIVYCAGASVREFSAREKRVHARDSQQRQGMRVEQSAKICTNRQSSK